MIKILKFSSGKQIYDFDCGVAVGWIMLKTFKIKIPYMDLMRESQICPADGLNPEKLRDLLKKYDLPAKIKQNANISFLKEQIKKESPVPVLIQARKEYKKSWGKSWKNGHYVIVIGFGPNKIFVFDPSMGGSIKVFSHKDFYNRWHDENEKKQYIKTAIYL